MQTEIINSVGNTILESNADLLMDIGEIGIDFVFDDSPLIELPIVKTVYSITKTGLAIRDRHLLSKLLTFINKLNTDNLTSEEYEKYKQKLKQKDGFIYQELEYIIIILDRMVQKEKALILANLYSAYINKHITFNEFQNFSLVLDNFMLWDKYNLYLLYQHDCQLKDMQDSYGTASRLISQGLAYNITGFRRNPISQNISFNPPKNDIAITDFGKKFYEFGFVNID
ncbi:hypothetical protein NNF28_10020 [Enterococcus faecium]|nr:hypothetical protein [Enterococcus faecium]